MTNLQQIDLNKLPNSLLSFKKLLRDCINIEYLYRVTGKDRTIIEDGLLEFATQFKLHTMFTNQGLTKVSEYVFEQNIIFRDFILSVTDAFFIEIRGNVEKAESGQFPETTIIDYLSSNIDRKLSLKHDKHNLMPKEMHGSIYGGVALLSKDILTNNDWFVVMCLIILCINDIALIVNQPKSE